LAWPFWFFPAPTERVTVNQLFAVEQSERTSDDYLTPRWVFETLDITFDLDVAAPPWNTHVPAARKYTKADDGLTASWEGRVWMNPPWSSPARWVDRFIEHGHGIAVVPWNKSAWVINLWDAADAIALPRSWFVWDGEASVWITWFFAAFGDECVEALGRLGRVR
jgi:hypothetical protein